MPVVSDATAEDALEGDERHGGNVDDVGMIKGLTFFLLLNCLLPKLRTNNYRHHNRDVA